MHIDKITRVQSGCHLLCQCLGPYVLFDQRKGTGFFIRRIIIEQIDQHVGVEKGSYQDLSCNSSRFHVAFPRLEPVFREIERIPSKASACSFRTPA